MVGYVNNPPYSFLLGNVASGNEVALIKSFTKEKGLDTRFIYGSETQLIKMPEQYKLK